MCSVVSGLAPNASTLSLGYSCRSCSCRLKDRAHEHLCICPASLRRGSCVGDTERMARLTMHFWKPEEVPGDSSAVGLLVKSDCSLPPSQTAPRRHHVLH